MSRLGIFFAPNNARSKNVGRAMAAGAHKLGIPFELTASTRVRDTRRFSTVIFYGLAQGLRQIWRKQCAEGRVIYIDLGYWGRRKRTRYDGYHKLALNSRHPTDYFQQVKHSPVRFRKFRIPIRPWRKRGKHILLAGMSAKAAAQEGFTANEWERKTIAELRKHTDRPIVYRPKPNWRDAKPLPGTVFGSGQSLEDALKGCHAVVTHHSNVAVDGLLAGVPCISPQGVASVMGGTCLSQIEDPPMPDGREQWAADVAWTQWSIDEMQEGAALRYLLQEGLVQ